MSPETQGRIVPPAGPPTFQEKLKREWAETSVPKKIMLGIAPIVMYLAWDTFRTPPPDLGAGAGPADSAMTAVADAGAPVVPTSTATTTATAVGPITTAGIVAVGTVGAVGTVPVPTGTATGPIPTGTGTAPVGTGTAAVPTSLPTAKADAGPGKSPERLAADAVAAGNYQLAVQIYDQLAVAAPDRAQIYQEAARILRAKLDAGVQ